jgi:hypothetical protein
MPYWTPARALCAADRARPAAAAHRAVARMGRLPRHARPSWPSSNAWARFLEGLGHQVDWALPALDYRAAFAAQTTCYISNFAQSSPGPLATRGLQRPPAELIEPINIRIWEAGKPHLSSCRALPHAGGLQHHRARLRRLLRGLGRHPDADHRAAHAADRHHRIPDDQRQPLGAGLVRQPVALLRLHAARQPVRHPGDLAADGAPGPRPAAGHPGCRPRRAATGCCCSWRRRSNARSAAAGTTAGGRGCMWLAEAPAPPAARPGTPGTAAGRCARRRAPSAPGPGCDAPPAGRCARRDQRRARRGSAAAACARAAGPRRWPADSAAARSAPRGSARPPAHAG